MKKVTALMLAAVMGVSMFAGCEKKEDVSSGTVDEGYAFNEMANQVEDSSDLPDWTGKKFDLKFWYAQGTGSSKRLNEAKNDVVTPEIYRVTGIKYSDESFDNGGELMDAKIAKIMASNDWPDIVFEPEKAVLEKMIEADMVYDLTDLIPKYCPNISATAEKVSTGNYLKPDRSDGRRYILPISAALTYAAPDLDKNLLAREIAPQDKYGYVYVRDDILKKIYPEAKSQKEIEDLYVKNGSFTKEEVYDVPIKTKKEFFDFLYKIKELGLKEGNFDVFPTYVADGYDNWSLLASLGFVYGFNMGGNGANYFTYWDKETKQVDYMFKQPQFKEVLKDWVGLVQDNVASQESLIDTRANFEEKVYNGVYAVLYGQTPALSTINETLESSGKPYRYRKVYLQIPANTDKYLSTIGSSAGGYVAILKNQIKEEDLPQILRFFDFAHSEAGQKLAFWGPRSAGLWTEENGTRRFVDEEITACMVYEEANEKDIEYNLADAAWPGYPFMSGSRYNPKLMYDMENKASVANRYFASGIVDEAPVTVSNAPNIWRFDSYGVKGVQSFWQARQAFEDALKKIFISENDKDFEKYYTAMIKLAEKNGLTDETLDEINKAYRESINVDFMSNLE